MTYTFDSTGTLGTAIIIVSLITLAVSIIFIVANWKILEKTGEPGWKCLIPVYNMYILSKIVFGSGWWFLLMFIPVVNFVFYILLIVFLGKAFDKSAGFCVGLVFLSAIFFPILAFGGSEYYGPAR